MKKIKNLFSNIAFFTFFIGAMAIFAIYAFSTRTQQHQQKSFDLVKRLDDIGDDSKGKSFNWNPVKKSLAIEKKAPAPAPKALAKRYPKTKPLIAPSRPAARPMIGSALKSVGDVELSLADLYNSRRYKTRPNPQDFSGSIVMVDGHIESLNVELPFNESIHINYSNIEGNTFTYINEDQEQHRGVIFQVGKENPEIVVSLNGGRLNGTRLKFMMRDRVASYQEKTFKKRKAVLAATSTQVEDSRSLDDPRDERVDQDEYRDSGYNEYAQSENRDFIDRRELETREFGSHADHELDYAQEELDEVERDLREAEAAEEVERRAENGGIGYQFSQS
jgi:hypothetical protein